MLKSVFNGIYLLLFLQFLRGLYAKVVPMRADKMPKYLILAMLAFAGLGMEVILAFFLEPLIYQAPMQSWTDVAGSVGSADTDHDVSVIQRVAHGPQGQVGLAG